MVIKTQWKWVWWEWWLSQVYHDWSLYGSWTLADPLWAYISNFWQDRWWIYWTNWDWVPVVLWTYDDWNGSYTYIDENWQSQAFNDATVFEIVQAASMWGTKWSMEFMWWEMTPEWDTYCQSNHIVPRRAKPETYPIIQIHYIQPDWTANQPVFDVIARYANLCVRLENDEYRLREWCRDTEPATNQHRMITYEIWVPIQPLMLYQLSLVRRRDDGKPIIITAIEMYYEMDTEWSFDVYQKYGNWFISPRFNPQDNILKK